MVGFSCPYPACVTRPPQQDSGGTRNHALAQDMCGEGCACALLEYLQHVVERATHVLEVFKFCTGFQIHGYSFSGALPDGSRQNVSHSLHHFQKNRCCSRDLTSTRMSCAAPAISGCGGRVLWRAPKAQSARDRFPQCRGSPCGEGSRDESCATAAKRLRGEANRGAGWPAGAFCFSAVMHATSCGSYRSVPLSRNALKLLVRQNRGTNKSQALQRDAVL